MNYERVRDDESDSGNEFELSPLAGTEDSGTLKNTHARQHSEGTIIDAVTSIVPESDDPTLPTLTFRVIVIGSLFVSLGYV